MQCVQAHQVLQRDVSEAELAEAQKRMQAMRRKTA
jgi:hypothetical protein